MVVAKEETAKEEDSILNALQKLFPEVFTSPTSAKKGCRRKEVLVDGVPVNTTAVVHVGSLIQLVARAGSPAMPKSWEQPTQDMPGLQVVFEDDYIAIVVKPPGLPTQGKGQDTLQRRIKYCLAPSRALGASHKPFNVHRLDAPTSGLVVCAKTRAAGAALASMFATRAVSKRYIAIVKGLVQEVTRIQQDSEHAAGAQEAEAGVPDGHVRTSEPPGQRAQAASNAGAAAAGGASAQGGPAGAREQGSTAEGGRADDAAQEGGRADNALQEGFGADAAAHATGGRALREGLIDHNVKGKHALTRFRVMQVTPSRTHGHLTTLFLHPLTGRKHQLRRHCVDVLGCGILGDTRYRGIRLKRRREYYSSLLDAQRGGGAKRLSSRPHLEGTGADAAMQGMRAMQGEAVEGLGISPSEVEQQAAVAAVASAPTPPALLAAQAVVTGCAPGVTAAAAAPPAAQQVAGPARAASGAHASTAASGSGGCRRGGAEGEGEANGAGAAGAGQTSGGEEGLAPGSGSGFQIRDKDVLEGEGQAPGVDGVGEVGEEEAEEGEEADEVEEDEEECLSLLADGTHLCLCAAELQFKHPVTGQHMHFSLPEPDYFQAARAAAMQ